MSPLSRTCLKHCFLSHGVNLYTIGNVQNSTLCGYHWWRLLFCIICTWSWPDIWWQTFGFVSIPFERLVSVLPHLKLKNRLWISFHMCYIGLRCVLRAGQVIVRTLLWGRKPIKLSVWCCYCLVAMCNMWDGARNTSKCGVVTLYQCNGEL